MGEQVANKKETARKHIHYHRVLNEKEKSISLNGNRGRIQPIKRIIKRLCSGEGQTREEKGKPSNKKWKQMRMTIKSTNGKQWVGWKPTINSQ